MAANDDLLDRTIRRAVFLEQYKNGRAGDIRRFIENEVWPDLIGKLTSRLERIERRGYDPGPATTKRLRTLEAELREIIGSGIDGASAELRSELIDFGKADAQWMLSSMRGAAPVFGELQIPSPGVFRQLVDDRVMEGKLFRVWFSDLKGATLSRVMREVRTGIAQTETLDQIVRRIRGTRANGFTDGVLKTSTRHAQTIARTAINHVSAQAREESFAANQNVIRGVQWVSTLDGRTSRVCQARDGNVYQVEQGPRPPAHHNCRSSVIPILRSWKELGIDLDEAPEGTRASMNGQVPEKTTYGEWLAKQSREVQNEALGKRRADLFREGRFTVKQFVNREGRTRTLAELSRLE